MTNECWFLFGRIKIQAGCNGQNTITTEHSEGVDVFIPRFDPRIVHIFSENVHVRT